MGCHKPAALTSLVRDSLVTLRSKDGASIGSNTRPDVGTLLPDRASDRRTLHLTLVVHDDTGVVLEVEHDTILSAERLALADDDCRHHLLAELRLALLAGRHDHVADASRRQPIQAALDASNRKDEEVLRAGVVSTIDDGCHRQTERHAVLVTQLVLSHCCKRERRNDGRERSCYRRCGRQVAAQIVRKNLTLSGCRLLRDRKRPV